MSPLFLHLIIYGFWLLLYHVIFKRVKLIVPIFISGIFISYTYIWIINSYRDQIIYHLLGAQPFYEELLKIMPIILLIKLRSLNFEEYISSSVCVASGVSFYETYYKSLTDVKTVLFRGIFSNLSHISFTVIVAMGLYYGKKYNKNYLYLIAYLGGVYMHYFYNAYVGVLLSTLFEQLYMIF